MNDRFGTVYMAELVQAGELRVGDRVRYYGHWRDRVITEITTTVTPPELRVSHGDRSYLRLRPHVVVPRLRPTSRSFWSWLGVHLLGIDTSLWPDPVRPEPLFRVGDTVYDPDYGYGLEDSPGPFKVEVVEWGQETIDNSSFHEWYYRVWPARQYRGWMPESRLIGGDVPLCRAACSRGPHGRRELFCPGRRE